MIKNVEKSKVFKKSAVKAGVYKQTWLDQQSDQIMSDTVYVSPQYLRESAWNTMQMMRRGLEVPVCLDHQDDAVPTKTDKWLAGEMRSAVGRLKSVKFNALTQSHDYEYIIDDPEIAKKVSDGTIRLVSPNFHSEFSPGDGSRFPNVIAHLALTFRPKDYNQNRGVMEEVAVKTGQSRFSVLSSVKNSGVFIVPMHKMSFSVLKTIARDTDEGVEFASTDYKFKFRDRQEFNNWLKKRYQRTLRMSVAGRTGHVLYFAVVHAPIGGVTINGRRYLGGQFIPMANLEGLAPEDRTRIEKSSADSQKRRAEFNAKFRDHDETWHDAVKRHVGEHSGSLSEDDQRAAARRLRSLRNHHGEDVMQRIASLAGTESAQLAKLAPDDPKAEHIKRRLAAYHAMSQNLQPKDMPAAEPMKQAASETKQPGKEPWEMTRHEYSDGFAENKKPEWYDGFKAISNKNNRKGYVPEHINDAAVRQLRELGYIKGTKDLKTTPEGRSAFYDADQGQQKDYHASADASDNHYDLVEKAILDGKKVPPHVVEQYPNMVENLKSRGLWPAEDDRASADALSEMADASRDTDEAKKAAFANTATGKVQGINEYAGLNDNAKRTVDEMAAEIDKNPDMSQMDYDLAMKDIAEEIYDNYDYSGLEEQEKPTDWVDELRNKTHKQIRQEHYAKTKDLKPKNDREQRLAELNAKPLETPDSMIKNSQDKPLVSRNKQAEEPTSKAAVDTMATKMAAHVAKGFETGIHQHLPVGFQSQYGDLDDASKKALITKLRDYGMVSQGLAAKRKPPLGMEIMNDLISTAKQAEIKHRSDPLNRHVPHTDSAYFKNVSSLARGDNIGKSDRDRIKEGVARGPSFPKAETPAKFDAAAIAGSGKAAPEHKELLANLDREWHRHSVDGLSHDDGRLKVGGSDFDSKLKGIVGKTFADAIRSGKTVDQAHQEALAASRKAIKQWNEVDSKSRVSISGNYQLKRWDGAGEGYADDIMRRFAQSKPESEDKDIPKQPWQMSKLEHRRWHLEDRKQREARLTGDSTTKNNQRSKEYSDSEHSRLVKNALEMGESVPKSVLDEYPEFASVKANSTPKATYVKPEEWTEEHDNANNASGWKNEFARKPKPESDGKDIPIVQGIDKKSNDAISGKPASKKSGSYLDSILKENQAAAGIGAKPSHLAEYDEQSGLTRKYRIEKGDDGHKIVYDTEDGGSVKSHDYYTSKTEHGAKLQLAQHLHDLSKNGRGDIRIHDEGVKSRHDSMQENHKEAADKTRKEESDKREADDKRYKDNAVASAQLKSELKGVKKKQHSMDIAGQQVKGVRYGDFLIHKPVTGDKAGKYVLTHIPSGKAGHKNVLSQEHGIELAHLLHKAGDWSKAKPDEETMLKGRNALISHGSGDYARALEGLKKKDDSDVNISGMTEQDRSREASKLNKEIDSIREKMYQRSKGRRVSAGAMNRDIDNLQTVLDGKRKRLKELGDVKMAIVHAPVGGADVSGHHYLGGQFTPSGATPVGQHAASPKKAEVNHYYAKADAHAKGLGLKPQIVKVPGLGKVRSALVHGNLVVHPVDGKWRVSHSITGKRVGQDDYRGAALRKAYLLHHGLTWDFADKADPAHESRFKDVARGAIPRDLPEHELHPQGAIPGGDKEADSDVSKMAQAFVQHEPNYKSMKDKYIKSNASVNPDGSIKSVPINTDEWREYIPGYVGTNAHVVHDAASEANNRFFDEMLVQMKGKGNGKVAILAGGGGSGKGTSVGQHFDEHEYPVRVDQTSDNYDKLIQKIDKIKKAGFTPDIVFVDRSPQEAWHGVVGRAVRSLEKGGHPRTVPYHVAVAANVRARQTALRLARENPDVNVRVIDNNGEGASRMLEGRDDIIEHLARKDYNIDEEQKGAMEHVNRLEALGKIPVHVAKGLRGEH